MDNRNWQVLTTNPDRNLLNALLANQIAGIIVPKFITGERCKLAATGILTHGVDSYKDVYPRIGKVGITQFEYNVSTDQKMEYFRRVSQADTIRKAILGKCGDLLQDVIVYLKSIWGGKVSVAIEDDLRMPYFAGLVRVLSTPLLLHYDWAPFDGPDWTISRVSSQITWNIFLQTGKGGATIVYDRPWRNQSDEKYSMRGTYEYDHSSVAGAKSVRIEPKTGDLVLFNSRNFHEVEETEGRERITISSFVGLLDTENSLVLWS